MKLADILRVEEKVAFSVEGCWIWMGAGGPYGYVQWEGRQQTAHRVTYQIVRGPIPEGLQLDHLCRVTMCVNPWHLEPVTISENRRRAAAARTHCPKGHPYDEENTYVWEGWRQCRACGREHHQRYRAAR